ncbi:acetamidase/formamidase family protein [Salinarchaeum sp. IM2453]|uniref:acetamidase/formamidase family protein n=1 Tax=Salinarchaeum sp. IM2453 TaxID=2862870 RepID=UPI001C834416|nr:acetamidase/formamidase family protein [Salinarchaeum sp. IM2453]QZA88493.1 acetamidase/formamidase family protein [Salinarchaeum sp. IM2453]
MDSNEVRPGATLICPAEIKRVKLYISGLHANQGDGELPLHTTDVSGKTELTVEVVDALELDGPILLPNGPDLHDIDQPYTYEESIAAEGLVNEYDVDTLHDMVPM